MKHTNETFVADVIEFNRDLLGIPDRPVAVLSTAEGSHLIKCLSEEVNELIDAICEGDVVKCVDAITDLRYFAVGGLYKLGLTRAMIVACDQAVHAANMTKVKAKVAKRHVEGAVDAGKPAEFIGPEAEIARILESRHVVDLCLRAIDAQAMALEHPTTFEVPSTEDLARISVGDHVKICAGDERFWVQVEAIREDSLLGRIDNELVCCDDHGLQFNDRVSFERRHVYTTL